MFSSVRVRLTLWYTGILALVLVVFATGVYIAISAHLYRELDRGLDSALSVAAVSLKHELEEHHGRTEGEPNFNNVLNTIHHTSFPKQAISVFAEGRLIAAKPGASPKITVFPAAGPGFHTAGAQRFGIRSLSAGGVDYRLIAAEPLANVETDLGSLRGSLLIAIPLALLLAAASGYLLARKSLAPVVAMSDQVNRITAGNLSERLTVVNQRDELGMLAATFNRLLHRLDASFEQQRRFMADASHELRTPIAVSRTAAQVTLEGSARGDAEYREALSIIAGQMQRLSRVVNDMFTLARADSGVFVLHRRRFYLNDVLHEALQAARLLALSKRIAIHFDPTPESPFDGDEDLIRQLVIILLDNAVKYTPEGGRIEVSLEKGYRLKVVDSGIGIPTEARDKIFDRFFRLDKARSRSAANVTGGAGLGLSIARWIAEVHGGSVQLESSTPGRGSVFVVSLPCTHPEPREVPAGIENGASVEAPPSTR